MDFDEQLESLREERERLEDEVREIKQRLDEKDANTERLRQDLRDLKQSVAEGEVPGDDGDGSGAVEGLEPVEVDPDSGRPPRGARSAQIEQAIKVISTEKDEFKAAELFELLQEADPSIDDNQRAYLYSKLKDLGEAGDLEKIGRGRWRILD